MPGETDGRNADLAVIPGRAAGASPESITPGGNCREGWSILPSKQLPDGVMDSGLSRSLSSGARSRDPLARPGMTLEIDYDFQNTS